MGRALKIAISGKGGVGKSTLAAALAGLLAAQDRRVLAVDADPVASLAGALGIPPAARLKIVPISQQKALIEARTGAKVKQYGQMFKLNPDVSDIARDFAYQHEGVALLVLGAVQQGGGGCACPESVLLRALVQDLVLHNDDAIIMDMEAGVEHLGRATARGVGTLLVVIEPGQRSAECAARIFAMGEQIGINDVRVVGNRVTGAEDEAFIRAAAGGKAVVGMIPDAAEIRAADREGRGVLASCTPGLRQVFSGILSALDGDAA